MSGVKDIVGGIYRAGRDGAKAFRLWCDKTAVDLRQGFPSAVVNALHKALVRSVCKGLWTSARGAIQIGLDVTVAGVGTLAKAMVSMMELIVSCAMRIAEHDIFTGFCAEARAHWKARGKGFHKDEKAFGDWFGSHAAKVPLIGAIALNCSYCGTAADYIRLVTGQSDDEVFRYQKALNMLQDLKFFAGAYMRGAGHLFYSKDRFVDLALRAALKVGKVERFKDNRFRHFMDGLFSS